MVSPAGESGGRDAPQQLLTLIRNFATERSQGERRVSDLKRRLLDLQAELEAAGAGLEEAKRLKEAAEHGLKGSEVELSMADASALALEMRTRLLQEEVSRVTSDLAALKGEEGNLRDEFINEMYELNKKIRNFRETEVLPLKKKGHAGFLLDDYKTIEDEKATAQDIQKEVEEKISVTNVRLHTLEKKYQEELCTHDEVLQMLANTEKRAFLGDAIIEETKQLQELARYPYKTTSICTSGLIVHFKDYMLLRIVVSLIFLLQLTRRTFSLAGNRQTAESEKVYATLGVELQKRFTCPRCQVNNMGVLEGTLGGGEG